MDNNPSIIDVTGETFNDIIAQHSPTVPVLVDFSADWCAPCKMLMPVLTRLAEEYEGRFILARVDTDEEQKLAGQHKVRGLPTVRLYRDNEVVEEFMGMKPESFVRAMIERSL